MSETKFTPGPWRAVIGDYGSCYNRHYLAIDDGCRSIAAVWTGDECSRDIPEHEANALLIASAPNLYSALSYARNLIGPDEIIDAALAKARGETP